MNKKLLISLLFILLGVWIAGSCYYYICKVRKNCETEIVKAENNSNNMEEKSIDTMPKKDIINQPIFLIKDGETIISESSTNISFAKGATEPEVPEELNNSLEEIASYLTNNEDKNLNIIGLYSIENESTETGTARANNMANYFESNHNINTDRLIVSSKSSDDLYTDEGTDKIIGGIEFEIKSNEEKNKEETTEDTTSESLLTNVVNPSIYRKVKGRKIMYYPLTNFEIEPTYELEKYFKNLKIYFSQNPDGLVQITGHTEESEDPSASRYKSKKYAEKVRNYLISEYEMNPRNFRIKGRGDTRQVTSSATDLGKAENRRIEFTFIK